MHHLPGPVHSGIEPTAIPRVSEGRVDTPAEYLAVDWLRDAINALGESGKRRGRGRLAAAWQKAGEEGRHA
ncbi:MAG: hypothetical protein WCQ77_13360 [Planctomycetota bacterium]